MQFCYQMFTILSEVDPKTSHIRLDIVRKAISIVLKKAQKYAILKERSFEINQPGSILKSKVFQTP